MRFFNHDTEKIRRRRSFLLIGSYIQVFLFGFLVFGVPSTPEISYHELCFRSSSSQGSFFFSSKSNSEHNPFEVPDASDSENQDKTNNQNQVKKDASEKPVKSIVEAEPSYLQSRASVFHFITSIQKRLPVSLYILYHSWKSFLPGIQ